MTDIDQKGSFVLGQKYAFATVSLVLGIACFINLIGLEKPILAVIFGWLALRAQPEPRLTQRRQWAQLGVALGIFILIAIPIIIIINFDRLREIIDVLSKMSGGR